MVFKSANDNSGSGKKSWASDFSFQLMGKEVDFHPWVKVFLGGSVILLFLIFALTLTVVFLPFIIASHFILRAFGKEGLITFKKAAKFETQSNVIELRKL